MVWPLLEIVGTIAFAFSGAIIGIEKKLDIFGIIMLSVTTAMGGGIIRDILIGNTPPLAFRDPTLLVISIIAAIVACFTITRLIKFKDILQIFDAIGLGAFTVTGASLSPVEPTSVFMMIVLGVITGVGGGVLRDIFAQEIPLVFRKEIYAVASIVGATTLFFAQQILPYNISLYSCFAITVIVRIVCIRYDIHLPKIGSNIRSAV